MGGAELSRSVRGTSRSAGLCGVAGIPVPGAAQAQGAGTQAEPTGALPQCRTDPTYCALHTGPPAPLGLPANKHQGGHLELIVS